ncbi:MAG: response regulator transcription factor [Candidatus Gracilibacteria bacterium]|nr:response regulator transcription factor [Candidatus Gracilibacteria bacterium]
MLKVLIVEDNEILSNNVAKYLELESIGSKQLFSGEKVTFELVSNDYDLVLLDLGLGDIDGIDVIEKIRSMGKDIPILVLTSRNTISDKKMGFKMGADDYLTKPFDYEELVLRIKALVRRNFTVKSEIINLNNIEIDSENKKVFVSGDEVHLSKLEFELLLYLVHSKTKVISKKQLLEKVWGENDDFSMTRIVDVYVGYLRKKLGKDIIETIRGEGYVIN